MIQAVRILFIGILAIATVSLLGAAIAIGAPYLAAIVVLWIIGAFIYRKVEGPNPD